DNDHADIEDCLLQETFDRLPYRARTVVDGQENVDQRGVCHDYASELDPSMEREQRANAAPTDHDVSRPAAVTAFHSLNRRRPLRGWGEWLQPGDGGGEVILGAAATGTADMLEDLLGDYNVELFGYYMLWNIELWVLKRSIQPAAAPVPAARRRIRLRSAFMN